MYHRVDLIGRAVAKGRRPAARCKCPLKVRNMGSTGARVYIYIYNQMLTATPA